MPIFILVYLLAIACLIYILKLYYKSRKGYVHTSYLLFSIFCLSIWLLMYLLSFTTTIDPDRILIFSRLLYTLSLVAFYSMTISLFFFGIAKSGLKKIKNLNKIFVSLIVGLFIVALFSTLFIKKMVLDTETGTYYEEFGIAFIVVQILYLLNPLLSTFIVVRKYRELHGLNKKRFLYISIGYLIFIYNIVLFLALLPMFNIWIMLKEQVIFFIPLIVGLWYPAYRYRFGDLTVSLGRILVFISSILIAIVIIMLSRAYFDTLASNILTFWGYNKSTTYIELIFVSILFFGLYKFLLDKFLSGATNDKFQTRVAKIRHNIPSIQSVNLLNAFLETQLRQQFNINHTQILLPKGEKDYAQFFSFFKKTNREEFFLNDYVFIEENKHKFSKQKMEKVLDDNVSIYIPLYKDKKNILGFLAIGHKNLRDYYSSSEIDVFIEFSEFLAGHLKYVDVYKQINELNLTLDKRVDEKTIEFNNLISRQKEFIAYLGHEVRNPITNTIFICSDIQMGVQDLKENKETKVILEDVGVLNDELVKIADLTKSIFSTEKMDLNKIKLYKKKLVLYDFIYNEIKTMEKAFPNIEFLSELKNVGEQDIDEVQFREVIHNLLTNSLKYVKKEGGKILVKLMREDGQLIIKIEDNGQGLSDLDIQNIFEKYATGNNDSIGLGMGLYLCKRIVELHGGEISAQNSKRLGGACFTIKL